MCDFRPGDEVVCVDASPKFPAGHIMPNGCYSSGETRLVEGRVYIVRRVGLTMSEVAGVDVGAGPEFGPRAGFSDASHFRKVQKRNDRLSIEAFSVIKDGGFEEPKRTPAKKRERA